MRESSLTFHKNRCNCLRSRSQKLNASHNISSDFPGTWQDSRNRNQGVLRYGTKTPRSTGHDEGWGYVRSSTVNLAELRSLLVNLAADQSAGSFPTISAAEDFGLANQSAEVLFFNPVRSQHPAVILISSLESVESSPGPRPDDKLKIMYKIK